MKNTSANLGPLMLDVQGTILSSEESRLLENQQVGGLILFSRNFESISQLKALVKQIRTASPNIIIAVDHEGGRVQRFREGFTRIPPMSILGELYLVDPIKALCFSEDIGWLMASELIATDIDISFAPVLDINFGHSEVIGDRAFSTDKDVIVELTAAFVKGMRDAGMASTGKHYPGHGYVAADSHTEIPIDQRPLEEISDKDLSVFHALVDKGLDALMPAHVVYPQVDDLPAGFSKKWLQEILRKRLGFEGVIFSDDLGMVGASGVGGYKERTNAALSAGCDMILVCNKPDAAKEVLRHLDTLDLQPNPRIASMRMQEDKKLDWENLTNTARWNKVRAQILDYQNNIDEQKKQIGE